MLLLAGGEDRIAALAVLFTFYQPAALPTPKAAPQGIYGLKSAS